MKKEKIQSLITEHFTRAAQKDHKIHNAYLLVHSEKLGIHLNMAVDSTGNRSANEQQPYFIASIGKLFTSVLIGILVEKGMISYEDTITQFLDNNLLHNLHVYRGEDYTNKIKIKHLLNHTSGLHDYFDDKPKQGKSMIDIIFDEPSRFWTPQETIQWSKEHLKSHEKMKDWAKFSIGIDYGYGLMSFRTIPLLMPKKYNVWGNAGSVGSFMFYHPAMDIYLIESLNQFRYAQKGIRLMFKIINILLKNKTVLQTSSIM